ncbi:hypothetical protein MKEN_00444800 [Mycena kentingensis (nom. inval.)]|nr:hypothetical protein MKEN_00444800 [Mycena kentingensis (nom. inval.)]
MFEDSSTSDYTATIPSSTPFTSTRALQTIVAEGDYTLGREILDALLEVGTTIPHSSVYQAAALAAIQSNVPIDEQIPLFKKWFTLIPTAVESPGHLFDDLNHSLFLRPAVSLDLIVEFGLIAADKGFAPKVYRRVVDVVCMYGDPDRSVGFLHQMLQRHDSFLTSTSNRRFKTLSASFRRLAVGQGVRSLTNAGWFDHAVQLIPDHPNTSYYLDPLTYTRLQHKMRTTADPRYQPHIDFVAQHKSVEQLRITGLSNMPKEDLAIAVICLRESGNIAHAASLARRLPGAGNDLEYLILNYLRPRVRPREQHVLKWMKHSLRMSNPWDSSWANMTTPVQLPEEYAEERCRVAMVALIRAWCLKEALALLPFYYEHNWSLDQRVYVKLLARLQGTADPSFFAAIEHVQQLLDTARRASEERKLLDTLAADEWLERAEPPVELSVLTPTPPIELTPEGRLAQQIRSIRRDLRNPNPQTPYPRAIIRFLEEYSASGRTRAIPLLRKFALRSSSISSVYILAEMVLHSHRGHHHRVIRTFLDCFYPAGVPLNDLIRILRAARSYHSKVWEYNPDRKRHPHTLHCAIIWRTLLRLTRDSSAVHELYYKMLSSANRTTIPAAGDSFPPLTLPPSRGPGLTASAFTPFIRRMRVAFGMKSAADILKDMNKLGITPTIVQLSEVAMAYSSSGDVKRTMTLLNHVERAAIHKRTLPLVEAETSPKRDLVPAVDGVFYGGVIRGFILKGRISAARGVMERAERVLTEEELKNEHFESLRKDLTKAELSWYRA